MKMERINLEQALGQMRYIFGNGCFATLRIHKGGIDLVKVVNQKYMGVDDEDDKDDAIMPPPLKVGKAGVRDKRPHYFG